MVFRIVLFWLEWFCVKMAHLSLAVVGFPLLPFAYVLKYHLGVKNVWLLNDTRDGDFGDAHWRAENNLKDKSLITFLRWWFRNSVWNFKLLTAPKWNGEYQTVKVYSNDYGYHLTWINQSHRGMNHVYYEVGGVLYGRFSFSNNWINIQLGTTGKRYNFKLRLI